MGAGEAKVRSVTNRYESGAQDNTNDNDSHLRAWQRRLGGTQGRWEGAQRARVANL